VRGPVVFFPATRQSRGMNTSNVAESTGVASGKYAGH
jgi:hypothetical protein